MNLRDRLFYKHWHTPPHQPPLDHHHHHHLRLSSTSFDFFNLIFQSFLYTPFDISTKNPGNPLDWIS
jgi:hypothetical protein